MLHGEGTTLQEEDEERKSIQPGRLTRGPTKGSFHNKHFFNIFQHVDQLKSNFFQDQCRRHYPRHHHHHHHHHVGCHLATDGGKNSVVDVEGVRRQDQGPKTLQVNMSVRKDVPEKNDIFGHCPKLPLPPALHKIWPTFSLFKKCQNEFGQGVPPNLGQARKCVFFGTSSLKITIRKQKKYLLS